MFRDAEHCSSPFVPLEHRDNLLEFAMVFLNIAMVFLNIAMVLKESPRNFSSSIFCRSFRYRDSIEMSVNDGPRAAISLFLRVIYGYEIRGRTLGFQWSSKRWQVVQNNISTDERRVAVTSR